MAVGLYSGVSGLALGTGLYKNVSGLWSGASGLTAGFGGGSPFGGASLYLDFLAGAPLDPRITFSRGSNATLVDSTGKITYAPANFFTYSQEFDNAAWLKQAGGTASVPVVTANAGTAPDGTETADRVQMTLNGGTTVSDAANVSQAAAYPAGSILQSIWLRSNTGANQTVLLVIGNTQPGGGLVTVTPTWQRFAVTQSVAAAGSSNSGIRLRGTFTGNTADILVWGAQLEPVTYQTTPSTYVATTASAYYGPRFDYDPVTLAAKGLLIEEQRTNLLTYSQQFEDAFWVKTAAAVSANTTVAPDGTTTADTLTEDATAATAHRVFTTVTVAASAHTASIYVKAGTRSWFYIRLTDSGAVQRYAYFNLGTGTLGTVETNLTASITNAGNGWYRCSATVNVAATSLPVIFAITTGDNVQIYNGNGTGSLFYWGAQLEAGAFATSYIPTVASTVTRSADVATMTGTNFSSWYNQSEGTFIADTSSTAASARSLTASAGAVANQLYLQSAVATSIAFNVFTASAFVAQLGSLPASALKKVAGAYKVNDFAASVDGGTVDTDTSGALATYSQLNLGANALGTGAFLNGHIRQIAYYNTRLSNTQLQTLTAPSLATTLSLSFTNQAYTVGV